MQVLETRKDVRICKRGSLYVVETRFGARTMNCRKRANKIFDNLTK